MFQTSLMSSWQMFTDMHGTCSIKDQGASFQFVSPCFTKRNGSVPLAHGGLEHRWQLASLTDDSLIGWPWTCVLNLRPCWRTTPFCAFWMEMCSFACRFMMIHTFSHIFLSVSAGVLLPLTARQSTINPEAVTLKSQHEGFQLWQSESSYGLKWSEERGEIWWKVSAASTPCVLELCQLHCFANLEDMEDLDLETWHDMTGQEKTDMAMIWRWNPMDSDGSFSMFLPSQAAASLE